MGEMVKTAAIGSAWKRRFGRVFRADPKRVLTKNAVWHAVCIVRIRVAQWLGRTLSKTKGAITSMKNNIMGKPLSRREFLRQMGLGALSLTAMSVMPSGMLAFAEGEADKQPIARSTYGWVLEGATQDEKHNVTIKIMEVPGFEVKTYTSAYPFDRKNELTGTYRADALVKVLTPDTFVEIMFNDKDEVIDMELVVQTGMQRMSASPVYYYYFTSAKYGGELTAANGGPGRMVAQGWVLAKDEAAKTITVGDGNHETNVFEETYTLADDCQIFVVDNGAFNNGEAKAGTWAGAKGSFADITLCPREGADGKCPGEIYYMTDKYTALCIFDSDYTQFDTAKVTELYLFKNPFVLTANQLVQPDGMAYDGCTWTPKVSKVYEKHNYGFEGSSEPFEVLKNRLYSIGDAYTCVYLIIGDDGSMSMLDQGNWCANYQYWLNVEKLGFNPREVKNIILTHGHGDHYQALYENVTMSNRYRVGKGELERGKQYMCVATSTQNATGYDYLGYPELGPELSDDSIRYCLTMWDEWYNWRDLGGGAAAYPFLTVGHSKDTASFGFLFEATAEDAVFEKGTKVGFVYMGGYGAKNNLNVGYQRLAYVDGLRYLQSVIAPYMVEVSDCVYNLPQHTNQYPWIEVGYASRRANVPFMSVLAEGLDVIQNFCEKRISYNTYEQYYQDWVNECDAFGNSIVDKTGYRCAASSKNLQTIEKYGPFKRPEGEYELRVDHAEVLHGFNAWQNPHEAFKDQENIFGFNLSQGFVIDKDSFVHNPDAHFVQIVGKVNDAYEGKVDYETNWYGAENYATKWTSGPVEIVNREDSKNWTEIVRTAIVGSKEDAEKLLATIQVGNTYKVKMTQNSDIVLAEKLEDTFTKI